MDPLEQMIAAEERDCLTGAICMLPERERLVLRMVDLEGISTRDTAACTALRHQEVRSALDRARQMLKARLA